MTEKLRSISIVIASDDNYFPLAKGLILSLAPVKEKIANLNICFLNIECCRENLRWLEVENIGIYELEQGVMGDLASTKFGYRRGQVCRPFLPELIPASVLVWMDCDTWVQDVEGFCRLLEEARSNTSSIYISPEVHIGYCRPSYRLDHRAEQMYACYKPLYGDEVAKVLCQNPTFNSGLFIMARENKLWEEWKREVERIYLQEFALYDERTLHLAEQTALNFVIRKHNEYIVIDPLYNFLCIWQNPSRAADGKVVLNIPPHAQVGAIHLGAWRKHRERYVSNGLLYENGSYLSDSDWAVLNM